MYIYIYATPPPPGTQVWAMFVVFMHERELGDAKLLVLANKQNLKGALTEEQATDKLGLHELQGHKWFVQKVSAISGEGL